MTEDIKERMNISLKNYPNTRQSFHALLKNLNGKKEIVGAEIGVYQGINSACMLRDCPILKLYCIDGYERVVLETGGSFVPDIEKDYIRDFSVNLLSIFGDRVIRVFKQSEIAYKDFPDGFFDYVYIDGEHLYEWVKRDIELWYPKVKKGGILAGHDYEMASVMRAVAEFRHINNMKQFSFSTGKGESDWWFIK